MTQNVDSLGRSPSGTLPARHWFTARLHDGEMGLSLAVHHGSHGQVDGRALLDAAAALYHAERWLPALEDWLGCGLLPQLACGSDSVDLPARFDGHVRLTHRRFDAEVHLPLSALQPSRAPPAATMGAWHWHPLACRLILDAMDLDEDALQGLEVGALLLLPASFASSWQTALQPLITLGRADQELFSAQLLTGSGRLGVSPMAGRCVPCLSTRRMRVVLEQTLPVDLAQLLGWPRPGRTASDAPQWLTDGAVVLWHDQAAEAPWVRGHLMPLGEGHALRIDEMLVPPDASHPAAHVGQQALSP